MTSFTHPPYVRHQEIKASTSEPLECMIVRSDNDAIVVNLHPTR
jgi:uncharacterized RmlC-like cupin family protein